MKIKKFNEDVQEDEEKEPDLGPFTRKFHKEHESKANVREILPDMVSVSNNSQITNIVANTLVDKLSKKEINDFKTWLKIVEGNMRQANKKRYY